MPLPAFLAAAAPVVGSLLGGLFGGGAQRRANQANKELAQFEWEKNLEMWNLQNQYNLPSAQMQRFRDAGLNPNLIYGQGSSGNAQTLPRFSRADQAPVQYVQPEGIVSMLGAFQDFQVKQAQVDNLREQNKLYAAQAKYADVVEGLKKGILVQKHAGGTLSKEMSEAVLEKIRQDIALKGEMFPYQLEATRVRTKQAEKQIDKIVADTEYQKLQNEWYVTKLMGNVAGVAIGPMLRALKGAGKAVKSRSSGGRIKGSDRAFEETTKRLRKFGLR